VLESGDTGRNNIQSLLSLVIWCLRMCFCRS